MEKIYRIYNKAKRVLSKKSAITTLNAILLIGLIVAVAVSGYFAYLYYSVPAKPREVRIHHGWGGSLLESFDAVLDLFEEEHPDIKLKRETSETEVMLTVLASMMAAGEPPDVISIMRPGWMADMARKDLLAPLDDLWEEKGYEGEYFSTAMKELLSVDGHVYGIPFKTHSKSCIWYNIPMFEDHGWNKEPKTWDELLALLQTIKDAGIHPFITGGKSAWPLTDWFENMLVKVAGPELYVKLMKAEIKWTHPKVLETFEVIKDLLDKGYFAPDPNAYGFYDAALKFGDGFAGVYLQGDFMSAYFKRELGWEPGVDFKYFPVPVYDPTVTPGMVSFGDWFSMPKDAKNPEEAKILLDFLGSPEAQAKYVEARLGEQSVPNMQVPPETFGYIAGLVSEELAVKAPVFDLSDTLHPEVETLLRSELQRFWADPATYEDVAATLQAKVDEVGPVIK